MEVNSEVTLEAESGVLEKSSSLELDGALFDYVGEGTSEDEDGDCIFGPVEAASGEKTETAVPYLDHTC